MNSKIINHKQLIKNAKALGVGFSKDAREKRFMAVLIMSAIVLAVAVGLSFAIDALKKLLTRF